MPRKADTLPTQEEDHFLTRVAWACEVEGITQGEAAKRFGVTRLKVNKALAEARRRGIVRVHIDSSFAPCVEAERSLCDHYGLDYAYVTPIPAESNAVQKSIGAALGHYLREVLSDANVKLFGMAWGNTLNLALQSMIPVDRLDLEIVSVMGGITRGSDLNNYQITTRLAKLCNAQHSFFTAPLHAGSRDSRDILMQQEVFLQVIEKIKNANALAMAVGDISNRSLLCRDGLPSDVSMAELIDAGAVGDILGYVLDAEGNLINHPLNERVIGIEIENLRRIPNVIMAAGGDHKVPIIKAVLARRVVNSLVTDEATATALLKGE
jgi:lsr operon transcriptional repressor